jgi:hypothetical protein
MLFGINLLELKSSLCYNDDSKALCINITYSQVDFVRPFLVRAIAWGDEMTRAWAMTSSFSRLLIGMNLTFGFILISGCATSNLNYTNQASVKFEYTQSEDVLIKDVYAFESGDELVILGKVKRTAKNCCDAVRGHLDIAIVAPDGLVMDAGSFVYSPRNIPKVRSRSSHFKAVLPYIVPEDFVLRITYHSSRELASSTTHIGGILMCEENKAIRAKEG